MPFDADYLTLKKSPYLQLFYVNFSNIGTTNIKEFQVGTIFLQNKNKSKIN